MFIVGIKVNDDKVISSMQAKLKIMFIVGIKVNDDKVISSMQAKLKIIS